MGRAQGGQVPSQLTHETLWTSPSKIIYIYVCATGSLEASQMRGQPSPTSEKEVQLLQLNHIYLKMTLMTQNLHKPSPAPRPPHCDNNSCPLLHLQRVHQYDSFKRHWRAVNRGLRMAFFWRSGVAFGMCGARRITSPLVVTQLPLHGSSSSHRKVRLWPTTEDSSSGKHQPCQDIISVSCFMMWVSDNNHHFDCTFDSTLKVTETIKI